MNFIAPPTAASHRLAFASGAFLFFLMGFITCLNDILVPHLKALFDLNYSQSMLIQSAFFSAYFFFSIPSGHIMRRLGYVNALVASLALTAMGALCFLPAGYLRSYPLFLFALFVLACGITLLQVAANPFITALGSQRTAPARLNFAQALNSLGTTLAPLIGTYAILSSDSHDASSTTLPYFMIACLLGLVAFALYKVKLPTITDDAMAQTLDKNAAEIDRAPLRFGILGIFCYVGAEVSIGSMLVSYIMQAWHIPAAQAGPYVTFYWFLSMLGRFLGSYLLARFRARLCLGVATFFATTLVLIGIIAPSSLSPFFIMSVGFFNSIMFPVIFSLSIAGLGRRTSQGASWLCMAIVGGAILPLMQGFISDGAGMRAGFIVPLVAYLYLTFFATRLVESAQFSGTLVSAD